MKTLLMLMMLMALPPISPPELEKQAQIIAVGTVINQTDKEEKADNGTNRIYTVQFVPDRVTKGKAPSSVTFTYWHVGKRPGGWAGPVGQNQILTKGQKVRVYLTGTDNAYKLLEPNGWEPVK